MKAFVFPGQGAQFVGMGKDLYEGSSLAHDMFEKANEVLGFRITDLMFEGTEDDLKQTKVTQPAIFLHSVILAATLGEEFKPDMAAGHSLGEFSALVAAGALGFEDGLRLVATRAMAMQKACEANPSTMAAVLALPDEKVEEICATVDDIVAPANYNCPGQVVISGTNAGIDAACEKLLAAGAKRALKLKVGGAFHSPLMEPAKEELTRAIEAADFHKSVCPVYRANRLVEVGSLDGACQFLLGRLHERRVERTAHLELERTLCAGSEQLLACCVYARVCTRYDHLAGAVVVGRGNDVVHRSAYLFHLLVRQGENRSHG